MFCSNCGARLDDNARFCTECGTKTKVSAVNTGTAEPAAAAPPIQGQRVTENIYLCADGVYRWVYEYRMMSNPTILFTIFKVLGIGFGAVYLFNVILQLIEGDLEENIGQFSLVFGILFAVFLVIGFISYVIVAAQNGWKYAVMFEMDDNGVTHQQMETGVKKAAVIQEITMLAGVLTGNMTTTGSALLIRTSMHSEFAKVRNIKVLRGRHTIKVNELLGKNQVYAEPADFDFVLNFIRSHIPAKTA